MDRFPLQCRGSTAGEVTAEREGLYTCFRAVCRVPDSRLWCVWVIGERDELRLGVVEPEGERCGIRRRVSCRAAEPLGRILRCELRPAEERTAEVWERVSDPEALLRRPWLRKSLRGCSGLLWRETECGFLLAIPWNSAKPFVLTPLMCFASVRVIGEERYAVFCFDRCGEPLLP